MNENGDKSVKELKQLINQDMPKLNDHMSLIADETESEDDEEVHMDDD